MVMMPKRYVNQLARVMQSQYQTPATMAAKRMAPAQGAREIARRKRQMAGRKRA